MLTPRPPRLKSWVNSIMCCNW
ncbi:MAG: hypothetical protein D6677_13345 [Calditrichaeota bacterium]|nr:MAG: hypothetical protein D6677_13345 [Calditrichota bacterium]